MTPAVPEAAPANPPVEAIADANTRTLADASAVLALLAVDSSGLGGANVRAPAGPVRDGWLDALRATLDPGVPWRRIPTAISAQRLLGGLDLAATLAAGRPVAERGLLAQSDGGVLVLAMAERTTQATASILAAVLDTGTVRLERDGLTAIDPARVSIIALDEGERTPDGARAGAGPGDGTPQKLRDRLAFDLDLRAVGPYREGAMPPDADTVRRARAKLASVTVPDAVLDALAAAADALGISSLRAVLFALKASRAAAALAGRATVSAEDAALAGRLVLAPRATRLPNAPSAPEPADETASDRDQQPNEAGPDPAPPVDTRPEMEPPAEQQGPMTAGELRDRLIEAAAAALPSEVLARLTRAALAPRQTPTAGAMGASRSSPSGGRPSGTRRGDPGHGARLDLVETLRAAAPWQAIRRAERAGTAATGQASVGRRIEVRRADFHVKRHQQPSETAIIFVVDASGSSALHRLAEAKGAVELLLADCYRRRDNVAVVAFRGTRSETLLPPTRSLVRAKRALASLPGGGATPLAAALDAATELAAAARRRGQTPALILLTDGRANIARDGTPGRERAEIDALTYAQAVALARLDAVLIDTSPKPRPDAQKLATTMNAIYLPLPFADAARLSAAVRTTLPAR